MYAPSILVEINPPPSNFAASPKDFCCPVVVVTPGIYVTPAELYLFLETSNDSLNPS